MNRMVSALALGFFLCLCQCDGSDDEQEEGQGYVLTKIQSPTRNDLSSVFMVSSDDVWAVGSGGAIVHWNGSFWGLVRSRTGIDLKAVYFTDRSNGWAVGRDGVILRYQNYDWHSYSYPTAEWLTSICFNSYADGWIAGSNGVTIHYNGTDWKEAGSSIKDWINDLSCISGGDLWAIGSLYEYDGTAEHHYRDLLHYVNNDWQIVKRNEDHLEFSGIAFFSNNFGKLLAMYQHGGICYGTNILKYNGNRLIVEKKIGFNLEDLHCNSPDDCWAAGNSDITRAIVHYDGDNWNVILGEKCRECQCTGYPINYHTFLSVHSISSNEAWVVGTDGKIFHIERR